MSTKQALRLPAAVTCLGPETRILVSSSMADRYLASSLWADWAGARNRNRVETCAYSILRHKGPQYSRGAHKTPGSVGKPLSRSMSHCGDRNTIQRTDYF